MRPDVPSIGPTEPLHLRPPFTGNLARNADYYRLEWLEDGFPGRRRDSVLQAHPIYGAYVLKDYVEQHQSKPSQELRDAIADVARVSLTRMEDLDGALVFWYEADEQLARAYRPHYSGLTQSYYAIYLAEAAEILDDASLREAAHRVFASLTVPADRGGVCYPGEVGPSVAEVPQEPNALILNGWQSALTSAARFAELTGSDAADRLVTSSLAEMARLLPLYDAPEVRNSRYGLTGFVYVRLVLRGRGRRTARLRDLQCFVPGEGSFQVPAREASRWENHVFVRDVSAERGWLRPLGSVVRANVVLSRVSFPRPNALSMHLNSEDEVDVEVQVHRGRYDPLRSSPVDNDWETVHRRLWSAGDGRLEIDLPWTATDLVAYPTNFTKKIEGEHVNIYHVVHINRLRELAPRSGEPDVLRAWAHRWAGYMGEWKRLLVYQGLYARTPGGITAIEDLPGG